MKRIITTIVAATTLAVVVPAQAGNHYGYVRNWQPELTRDIIFDILSNPDVNTTTVSQYVIGSCGSGAYRMKANNPSFTENYIALLMAAKNNYRVMLYVTNCDANNVNIIDTVKVCTWTGNC